jgi:hypothetical protein
VVLHGACIEGQHDGLGPCGSITHNITRVHETIDANDVLGVQNNPNKFRHSTANYAHVASTVARLHNQVYGTAHCEL